MSSRLSAFRRENQVTFIWEGGGGFQTNSQGPEQVSEASS